MEPSGAFCIVVNTVLLRLDECANLEILLQAGKIKTDGLLVKVPVTADLETGITENGSVVSPRWYGEVDSFIGREETAKESTANSERTGTRDGLGDGNL
jgi:hypothetical protein